MSDDPSHPPSALDVAHVATGLFDSAKSQTPDRDELEKAASAALDLIKIAGGKKRDKYAFELFSRDSVMTWRDIAAVFKEHEWPNMMSHVTVESDIREILDSMFEEIQSRRSILSSIFLRKLISSEPHLEATHAIKVLLEDMGMSAAFGDNLDFAVERFWGDMVEAWVWTDEAMKEKLGKTGKITPSFFTNVCVNKSYEDYARYRLFVGKPKGNLLIGTAQWLDVNFRESLRDLKPKGKSKALNILRGIDYWLGTLTDARSYSEVFAECVESLESNDAATQDNYDTDFNNGLRRYGIVMARTLMKELSQKVCSDEFVAAVDVVLQAWKRLASWEKVEFSAVFFERPASTLNAFHSFAHSGYAYFQRTEAVIYGPLSRYMSPYLLQLESLISGLHDLQELSQRLNVEIDLTVPNSVVLEEKDRITSLIERPVSDDSEQQAFISALEEKSNDKCPISQVRPYLVFRYAYERSLLEGKLVTKS